MHNHPIAENGSYRASFATCHQLGRLMWYIGDDLVAEHHPAAIAWGLYSPYAHAASWDSSPEDWHRLGFTDRPRAAWRAWDSFMALCDRHYTANDLVHLAEESVETYLNHRLIVFEGSLWMDRATQQKLVDDVRLGGTLMITGSVPDCDEYFRPCTLLRDALYPFRLTQPMEASAFRVASPDGNYAGGGRGLLYPILLDSDGGRTLLEAHFDGHAHVCGAVLQPDGFKGCAAPPRVTTACGTLSADAPCDLLFVKTDNNEYFFSVANVQTPERRTLVQLPIPREAQTQMQRLYSDGHAENVPTSSRDGWITVEVFDMQPAHDRVWSPGYRISIKP